jgi:hypothetical protein
MGPSLFVRTCHRLRLGARFVGPLAQGIGAPADIL